MTSRTDQTLKHKLQRCLEEISGMVNDPAYVKWGSLDNIHGHRHRVPARGMFEAHSGPLRNDVVFRV